MWGEFIPFEQLFSFLYSFSVCIFPFFFRFFLQLGFAWQPHNHVLNCKLSPWIWGTHNMGINKCISSQVANFWGMLCIEWDFPQTLLQCIHTQLLPNYRGHRLTSALWQSVVAVKKNKTKITWTGEFLTARSNNQLMCDRTVVPSAFETTFLVLAVALHSLQPARAESLAPKVELPWEN